MEPVPKAAPPGPPGFHAITPHLNVNGTAACSEFLQRAFGGREVSRSPGPGSMLMHVEVQVSDSRMMFADHFPEFGAPACLDGHYPFHLNVYVPEVDAVWAKAIEAGCRPTLPLADMFWGDRYGAPTRSAWLWLGSGDAHGRTRARRDAGTAAAAVFGVGYRSVGHCSTTK
jgi:PhnB protein